jgi:hypothetical protein
MIGTVGSTHDPVNGGRTLMFADTIRYSKMLQAGKQVTKRAV